MKEKLNINDDLLVKVLLKEAIPEEIAAVEHWLEADSANRIYYGHIILIWEESLRNAGTVSIDDGQAWLKFRHRIRQDGLTGPYNGRHAVPRRHFNLHWLRIAAIFLLTLTTAFAVYLFVRPSAALVTKRSGSKVMTDTLPDGSLVTLNKNSILSYPAAFSGPKRIVQLQGEAFFSVTPDKARPFSVLTDNIAVTALGTSFNVCNRGKSMEIIVETGLVEVKDNYHNLILAPREKLILYKNDTVFLKETTPDQLYKYYRTKTFTCDNTPLWQLVEALNETFTAKIMIDRPSLRDLRLSATFHDESLDHIISVIAATFGITVTRSGNQIHLR